MYEAIYNFLHINHYLPNQHSILHVNIPLYDTFFNAVLHGEQEDE